MESKSIVGKQIARAVVLVFVLAVLPAYAMDCYQNSPRFTASGDRYFELEQQHGLTGAEKSMLDILYGKIKGNWRGTGSEMLCIGSRNSPKKRNSEFVIESAIDSDSRSGLTIRSAKRNMEKKISTNETPRYFGRQDYFAIEKITENSFKVIQKYRKASNQLWEVISTLTLENDRIKLEIHRYVNGHFSSYETQSLSAD